MNFFLICQDGPNRMVFFAQAWNVEKKSGDMDQGFRWFSWEDLEDGREPCLIEKHFDDSFFVVDLTIWYEDEIPEL